MSDLIAEIITFILLYFLVLIGYKLFGFELEILFILTYMLTKILIFTEEFKNE